MYKAHYNLNGFGEKSQYLLQSKSALVIGCGGIGSNVAYQLSSSGISKIGLCDFDKVDISNIHRQIFNINEVDSSKVYSLAKHLSVKSEVLSIVTYNEPFNQSMINDFDIICDCTDNMSVRYEINTACQNLNKDYYYISCIGYEGHIAFNPDISLFTGKCNCNDDGVLGPAVSTVASMASIEIIKYLCDLDHLKEMLHVDLLDLRFIKFKINHYSKTQNILQNSTEIYIDLRDFENCDTQCISCPFGTFEQIKKYLNKHDKFCFICETGNYSSQISKECHDNGYTNTRSTSSFLFELEG